LIRGEAMTAWSPDGRQIAYYRLEGIRNGGVFLVSPLGGPSPTAKVHGTIKQRRLINYQVDPVMMERLLPDHDTT